jgi:Fe/S biogenesis protein NfuA
VDEVIRVTPAALALVREALATQAEPSGLGLWLEVNGIANGQYTYDLWFGQRATIAEGDAAQIEGEVFFVVPAESVARLRGAVLDRSERRGEAGLVIVNPNTPGVPTLPAEVRGELQGPVARAVLDVLERELNPFLAGHGGRVVLVGIDGAVAYVEMSGGCQGCGMAQATLSEAIAVAITDAVSEIREVVDVTDHAYGTHPFYEPGRV